MNKRTSERFSKKLPVKMHFFGEQVDITECEDISTGGFFVRTESVRDLEKGVVALVSINLNSASSARYLAEVVRVNEHGAAFQVIESDMSLN